MATTQKEKTGGMAAVADAAKDEARKAGGMIKDAASYVGEKADDATAAVGSGMESLADTIRDKGPHSGPLGSAGSTVANTLESSGRYLQEHGLSGIADDLTKTIRRHPVPAMLVGVGIGFLVARALGR